MARRDDRPPQQNAGQWTFYRGRWWRFTGTSWIESDRPAQPEQGEPAQTLRYHRDVDGTYWLQHPRTGEWHRHENGAWNPSETAPHDLDPEPLSASGDTTQPDRLQAMGGPPHPTRWIIALSAAVVAAVIALLLVNSGGAKQGAAPPTTATTQKTGAHHPASSVPATSLPTTTVAVPTTAPPTTTSSSTTSTTGRPGTSVVRLRSSGVGPHNTRRVRVSRSWHIEYSFNCANEGLGATDNFIVDVIGYGAAIRTSDSGVNTLGPNGKGIVHYMDSGTFSLSVNTGCRWKIRVVEP